MAKTLIKNVTIVTMDTARRIIRDGAIVADDGIIESVMSGDQVRRDEDFSGEVVDGSGLTAIPGFVQTHIHLCQTLFRGLADDLELLDWLNLRILPFEAAHTAPSMRASALLGLAELIRSGTTTIMDMGSLYHEEQIVEAVEQAGIRAFVGKAMMDINDAHPRFRETSKTSLAATLEQARAWHGSGCGRIRYAVAPRFILSCTDGLLKEAAAMTDDFPGMLFHTHASENRREMEAVRRRCGMDNVEYFDHLGILRSNSCLAHCVWVSDREIGLLAKRKAKVLHCPSSNLKLGSGVARVPAMLGAGIALSLGADGAPCNNTLDMFGEMRLAALVQKPDHGASSMSAETVFGIATIGGATVLGMEKEIGSLEAGKRADIVLLDLRQVWNPLDVSGPSSVYSSIVFSGSPANVSAVMADGRWLFRGGTHQSIDEDQALHNGRDELARLLKRADPS
jgi:5-methylthioadenosine/S-adenosylhomocysteine deaminase